MSALPIIAKAIGRRYGVTVNIGGSSAFTDGNKIQLPALPADDPEAEVLVNGYLDHEAAHCRFTDFEVERSGERFQQWIENALEDIRIESAMGQHYPGCQRNLDKLTAKLVADGVEEAVSDEAGETEVLSAFMLHRLRSEVLGQEALDEHAAKATERVEAMFPKGLCVKLSAMLAEVRQARSTADVIDLAARVAQLLNDESEAPEESEQSDQSDTDQSSGGDGDDADRVPNDDGDQGGDQDGGQGDGQAGDQDDNQAQPASGSESDSGGDDARKRREALRSAMNPRDDSELREDRGKQVAHQLEARSKHGDCDEMATADDEAGNGVGGGSAVLGLDEQIDEASVRRASARLRARLAGLIQTEALELGARGRSGKRIDRRMLPRLGHGDPRIFRVPVDTESVDTAVTVLLDRSGSMAGNEIAVAREAALAMAYVLSEIESVNPSVFAFPGWDGYNHAVIPLHRRGWRVSPKRFGVDASGGTPLTEAAWYAGWDLLCAEEPRKILVVITDGVPNRLYNAIGVLERMRESGIETVGLGIQQVIPPALIPESRCLHGVAELSSALFELLERKLVTDVAA